MTTFTIGKTEFTRHEELSRPLVRYVADNGEQRLVIEHDGYATIFVATGGIRVDALKHKNEEE